MGNLQAARVNRQPSGGFHQWGHSARVAALIFFWHRAPHPLHHHCSQNISYINMLYIYILLFYDSSVAPNVLYHTIMVVIVLATLTSDTNLSTRDSPGDLGPLRLGARQRRAGGGQTRGALRGLGAAGARALVAATGDVALRLTSGGYEDKSGCYYPNQPIFHRGWRILIPYEDKRWCYYPNQHIFHRGWRILTPCEDKVDVINPFKILFRGGGEF